MLLNRKYPIAADLGCLNHVLAVCAEYAKTWTERLPDYYRFRRTERL